MMVWDECHHIAAGTWDKIFKAYPNAYHIGLTATPERLDGKGLSDWFKVMVNGPSVKWLVDNGFLAPFKLYAPSKVDMTGVRTRMGDFDKKATNELIDKPTITGDVIKEYKKLAKDKRAVVFCVSVKHSQHVASQFIASGIAAAHVDGTTPTDQRDRIIEDFSSGRIKVLCNVDLFGEGFDLPAMEAAILLRPTQSLSLYLQQVGRVLRPSEGKEQAIIIDHVANYERHGFPDDEREWNLNGRAARKRAGEKTTPIKICDACFAAQFPGTKICKYCGYEFKVEPRKVEEIDGELEEIKRDKLKKARKSEQGHASTLEDLVNLGKTRGYKNPHGWAHHIYNARKRKSG
jgi:superfamily II DNA or RNA helicase